MTRYDTETGLSRSAVNPLPGQRIVSLWCEPQTAFLLAGTSYDADCKSSPPTSATCYLARLSSTELRLLEQLEAPAGTAAAVLRGPLGPDRWLCQCAGRLSLHGAPVANLLVGLESAPALRLDLAGAWALPTDWRSLEYVGRPGLFLVHAGEAVELWDLRQRLCRAVLYRGTGNRRLCVDRPQAGTAATPVNAFYLVGEREITVVEVDVQVYGLDLG